MYERRGWTIAKYPHPSPPPQGEGAGYYSPDPHTVNLGFPLADRVTEAAVIALTVLGWAVLAYVVLALPVTPGAQAVFYTSGFVALAGSTALVYELYQSRTRGGRSHRRAVLLLGTGMRLALAVDFALWLQSLRALTAGYLVLLVGAFLFLEFLARQATEDRDRGRG